MNFFNSAAKRAAKFLCETANNMQLIRKISGGLWVKIGGQWIQAWHSEDTPGWIYVDFNELFITITKDNKSIQALEDYSK